MRRMEFLVRDPRGRAAAAYFLAGAATSFLVAWVDGRRQATGSMYVIFLAVSFLFAWWVARGVAWVTRALAILCALRAAQHFFMFVYPDELYWNLRGFPDTQFPLADGRQHPAYFATGMILATAATFLVRAGWPVRVPAPNPPP